MTLTLTIRNMARLDNGMPAEFVLARRGAIIGRSPTCDWSLPDPRHYISSRHLEVSYRDGFYLLSDISTNGTFLNGATERMAEPRRVEQGDRFQVGQYELVAELTGEAIAAVERQEEAAQQAAQASNWGGWNQAAGAPAPPPPRADPAGWAAPPQQGGADAGWGPPPYGGSGGSDWGPAPSTGADAGWGTPASSAAGGAGGWDPPAAAGDSGGDGWGAPPVADARGEWGATPPAAAASNAGWAPKTGPSLARDAAHVAHARGSTPAAPSGAALLGGSWAPAPPPPEPVSSPWAQAQAPVQSASGWSSAVPDRPPAASPDDIWGKIADGNVVDWARGGFGQPVEQQRDPLGLARPAAADALPKAQPRMAQFEQPAAQSGWAPPDAAAAPPQPAPAAAPKHGWAAAPADPATIPPTPMPPPPAPTGLDIAQVVEMFAGAAGLKPGQLKQPDAATLQHAAQLLRQLVSGLVVMVEARARAKSQMGAEATSLNFDGNNPIKFARSPEQAVAQLLNPKERGFMDALPAVEDAFYDLQSHQMATLKAMQGALRATLDRFSPTAIKARADSKGLMAKIMPGAREAALWQAYEREFGGVAQGSDEAFMDVFAKEFRKAYEQQSQPRRR